MLEQVQLDEKTGIWCSFSELISESKKTKGFDLHLRRRAHATGAKRSSVRGRGMEFFESRPYVAQDEMRAIDWKVSARFDGLFTKVFVEERERPIFLVVDQSPSMFFGSKTAMKSVTASRIAARLAGAAINGGDQMGGVILKGDRQVDCQLKSGSRGMAKFFGQLADASLDLLREGTAANPVKWSSVFRRMGNRLATGSAVFLISDFFSLGEEDRHPLYSLRKRADVFAIAVRDRLEDRLPDIGVVGLACRGQEVVLDSSDPSARKRYMAIADRKRRSREGIFSGLNIPLVEVYTDSDLTYGLKKIFFGRW